MREHLDLFVDEGRESITAMNNGLLALEAKPTDEEALAAVFRHAHTLKGNAAALGFSEISELAHVLEDLLDDVRSGAVTIGPHLIDELLGTVDLLEAMLGEIDESGETGRDPSDRIARLEAIAADGSVNGDSEPTEFDSPGIDQTDDPVGARVTVTGEMAGVDATIVLNAIEAEFDAVQVSPDRAQVERGDFDGTFELGITGDTRTLKARLSDSPHVERFELLEAEGETADRRENDSDDQLSSVRVDIDRLIELNELVEQLVTSRIRIKRELERKEVKSDAVQDLDKISQRLRDVAMEMRLVPFDTIARGFPRVVRDTARDVNKEVDFSMTGTEVEVDRRLLTRLKDPLIHVLRNAVDHGIESAAERDAAGKRPAGKVEIDVRRERDEVVVAVSDDGGGIDVDAVRHRAIDEEIDTTEAIEAMADDEIFDLLFHPGLSTASEVTDVSGRGVGMDVVRETVAELDGSVTIESAPTEGTTVRFRLPVTMAVADVMLLRNEGEILGVPIADIEEIATGDIVKRAHGRAIVDRSDGYSPVIDLGAGFQADARSDGGTEITHLTEKKLIIIREDKRDVALACDAVMGQEEVVVKPLAGPLAGTPGVSGTAVLGDQQLVPIIDVGSI